MGSAAVNPPSPAVWHLAFWPAAAHRLPALQHHTMTTLATHQRIGGFDLHQIERRGEWAVFEQSRGGRVTSYELVQVQVQPANTMFGRDYPEREIYPGSESWGKLAWTITDRQDALGRLSRVAGVSA